MNDYVDLTAFDARLQLVSFALSLLAIGVASLCASAFLRKTMKVERMRSLRGFWNDEEGASYSISFVMVLPFYVFFMCFTLEIMFLMIAKLGAVHACQAAVRAAAVHVAVVSPEDRKLWIPQEAEDAAKKAAVVSMIPFASALDPDYQNSVPEGVAYSSAYKDFIGDLSAPSVSGEFCEVKNIDAPLSQRCVERRYSSAQGRISLKLSLDSSVEKEIKQDEPWRKCITCELTYRAPFSLPLIGRVLGGEPDGSAIVRNVYARASAQIECPKNKSGFLGVAIPWNVE